MFVNCLGVVVILLLNVMEVFSVGGSVLLDRPCMVFQSSTLYLKQSKMWIFQVRTKIIKVYYLNILFYREILT